MDPDLQERIKRLEEKVAYLERHVTAQDRAMLEMADDITALRRELKRVQERNAPTDRNASEAGEDERPPHY